MDVTKLFERGSQAFERGSWELAIMVWQQLLAMQPDHIDARKLLREAENRKWTQDGAGSTAKFLAYIRGLSAIVTFVSRMLTKNYDRAMIDCEKVLVHDPNCMPALWGLAQAATKGGHADVAIVTLEYMLDRRPKSKKVLRHLGHRYEEKDEIVRAIDAWQKLKALVPNDREAQTKLRDLAAVKTMVDGRYETATQEGATYRESLRSKEESEELEQKDHIIRTAEDLDHAIERVTNDVDENPNNKRYVLQLGDLYRRAKNYEKARALYTRAGQIDQMDFSIPERLGELRIEEYTEQEKALAAKAAASPDDAAIKTKLDAARTEKFDFSRKEYQRQVSVRPTDAGLREKLGDLCYDAKMFDEAAVEYQKAATDPRKKRRCLKRLGLCLYNGSKYQLAASQFEQACEGGNAASPEIREILYYLGVTYEKLRNLDRAEETFRQIFDIDMSYKDVQARLDSVMQAKQKQQSSEPKQPKPEGETE